MNGKARQMDITEELVNLTDTELYRLLIQNGISDFSIVDDSRNAMIFKLMRAWHFQQKRRIITQIQKAKDPNYSLESCVRDSFPDAELTDYDPEEEQISIPETVVNYIRNMDKSQWIVFTFFAFMALIVGAYVALICDTRVNLVGRLPTKYVLCNTPLRGNCIHPESIEDAEDIAKDIFEILQDQAINYYCSRGTTNLLVANDYEHISRYRNNENFKTSFLDAKYLMRMNGHWNIRMLDDLKLGVHFGLDHPVLPLSCMLRIQLKRFFVAMGVIAVVIICWFFVSIACEIHGKQKTLIQDTAGQLATDIFNEIVAEEKCPELDVGLLIAKLIPSMPTQLHDSVVIHTLDILERDKRVILRVYEQNRHYVHSISWNTNVMKTIWQRPVIRQMPSEPATSNCLKILNLLSGAERRTVNTKGYLVGLIHSKIGEPMQMYDLQIDWKTGQVFIRCSSKMDAGILHSHLHGWWYDRRILTVEYVTQDFYMTYFPEKYSSVHLQRGSVQEQHDT